MPQPAAQQPPLEAWDYCEIRYAEGFTGKRFEAVASGPKGLWVVEKQSAYKNDDAGTVNRANITALVNKLAKQGWEAQPKGSAWYAHRFRRPALRK